MKLSVEMRKTLVEEIRYAVEKMSKSERLNDKVYFFSAVYGIIDRVFNLEYDPELIFIYQVTRQAFEAINQKLALMTQAPPSYGTSIPQNLFPRLQDDLVNLAEKIEKDQSTYALLQDIANISYSVTGNGSYLVFKGLLKI